MKFFRYGNKAISLHEVQEIILEENSFRHTVDKKSVITTTYHISILYTNGNHTSVQLPDDQPKTASTIFDSLLDALEGD